MGPHGRSVLKQFAMAGGAAAALWFGTAWLTPHVIRGLLGGW